MPVYVDDMQAPFGRMVMCHLIADTTEELLAMADKIGVARKWIQHPGTPSEHFDIALSKRAAAVRHGAIEITWRQCGAMTKRMMVEGRLGEPEEAEEWLQAYYERRKKEEERKAIPRLAHHPECPCSFSVSRFACNCPPGWPQ